MLEPGSPLPEFVPGLRLEVEVPLDHPWSRWLSALRTEPSALQEKGALTVSLNGTQESYSLLEANLAERNGRDVAVMTWKMDEEKIS